MTSFELAERLVSSPFSMRTSVEHFALITHAVPASRVRPLVPYQYELETFTSDTNRELAFVSVACFFNRGVHWSMSPRPKFNFEQCTYRTYVRRGNRVGVYFFGTYLGKTVPYLSNRFIGHDVFHAKIKVNRDYDETQGYKRYSANIESSFEQTSFELSATHGEESVAALKPKTPFVSAMELGQHLSYRLHGFLASSLGFQVDQFVLHRRLRPWYGNLISARFDLWERLGILEASEAENAYSVVVEPKVEFTLFPPIPVKIWDLVDRGPKLRGLTPRPQLGG